MSPSIESATDIVAIPLDRIPTDEGAQARVKVRAGVVKDYATAMTEQMAHEGLRFPPVILFTDGVNYWLGDGFHRVLAARKAGLTEIAAQVRPGNERDALLYGISANNGHGLPRTTADKRRAVAVLLADAEWSQWSDREIARRCQVGNVLVSRMRGEGASVSMKQMRERKVERAGKVYEMSVPASVSVKDVSKETAPANGPTTDLLGISVPEPREKVFTAHRDFQEAHELFERLAKFLDRIAHGPAGDLYRQEMIRTADGCLACVALRTSRNKLLAAEPYCSYCPNCHPSNPTRPYPACKSCHGRGWTTRAAYDSCRQSDREAILKMRDSK